MPTSVKLTQFARDTLEGLTAPQKFLLPKYFYDDRGSQIFEKIMRMPEYYLTACEYEIFSEQADQICNAILPDNHSFELIELGPGDGLKSRLLLARLQEDNIDLNYLPVDISGHALSALKEKLKIEFPGLNINEYVGDYFQVLKSNDFFNGNPKTIFFLGSNIGNFYRKEREYFLKSLSEITRSGDKLLIGFDLKKSPDVLLKAYDDEHGFTRDFNLNHLIRINSELDANFQPENFEHHVSYDPLSGAMNSYLVSKKEHKVFIGNLEKEIHFSKWEPVFMELSQKFDHRDIENMAENFGFGVLEYFTDRKGYFTDSLWIRK
ncbi:MAG: hypothetical protein EA393_06395 [Bacteroidetes bacterium]|nr:MAG: hypothetical protein EA393_06395 [Bacteroidota bacterium]